MRRCYKQNHPRYHLYGGSGVTICEKWRRLEGFIEEVDLIEGFNSELLVNGKIHLDKDSKDIKNKIYCLSKCKFISIEENNKYKPNQQRNIIGTSPNGDTYEFFNQSEFAREHNLRQTSISGCLKGKCKTHKKWEFKYKQ